MPKLRPFSKSIRGVYRTGPIWLTVLIILTSIAYGPWASYRDEAWLAPTLNVLMILALVWHLCLMISERNKAAMVGYAVIHLPIMLFISMMCGMALTGNWL
jgi:hypothetical protein